MSRLARINVHPIKSLDGVSVDAARIGPKGGLEWDRRFAICDGHGEFVNAKRTAAIHKIRAEFDLARGMASLLADGRPMGTFDLASERGKLAGWLSEYLGFEVGIVENAEGGFPDDVEMTGPTIVSVATLETVSEWFGLTVDETRRRFRANLEVEGVAAFWEDGLFDAEGPVAVRIGEVELFGQRSSERCVVPSRSATSGEITAGFQKRFAELREKSLPGWSARAKFNHFYRMATNTTVNESSIGKSVRVGDFVERPTE